MNKIVCLSFILVLLAYPVLAQEPLGARPMGMGGAFTGLADDVNAIFINPAGIVTLPKESILASTRIDEGREYTMIGGIESTPFGTVGVGYVGSTDPIAGSTTIANGDSPVKYSTQTLYLTMAKDMNKEMHVPLTMGNLCLGMNLKFASRKLGTANGLATDGGSSVDMDVASVFKLNPDLQLGLSLQNLFGSDPLTTIPNLNTAEERNSAVSAGAAGRLFGGAVTWSLAGTEQGCEWKPLPGLAFRAGRGADNSITSGLGINLNGFAVDYAYVNSASPVHYWSVSIVPQQSALGGQADISDTL